MRILIPIIFLLSSAPLVAQQFGGQEVITTSADGAYSVYATDLDGDGDADVLSASVDDDKIAWYENLGGGTFDWCSARRFNRGRRTRCSSLWAPSNDITTRGPLALSLAVILDESSAPHILSNPTPKP
jgi:hypothetical protein